MAEKAEGTGFDVYFPGKPAGKGGEQHQFCVRCLVWVPVKDKVQHIQEEHPEFAHA
jgi:hypothetical protein